MDNKIKNRPKLIYIASDSVFGEDFIKPFLEALNLNFEITVINIVYDNHTLVSSLNFESIYVPFEYKIINKNQKQYFLSTVGKCPKEMARSYSQMYYLPKKYYENCLINAASKFNDIPWENYQILLTGLGSEPHKLLCETLSKKRSVPTFVHGDSPTQDNSMFIYETSNSNLEITPDGEPILGPQRDPKIIKTYALKGESANKKLKNLVKKKPLEIYKSLSLRIRYLYNFFNRSIFKYFALKSIPKGNFKILFFPLHITEDSQILYRNFMYKNQGAVIKRITDTLPSDWRLIVKAHPGKSGRIPLNVLPLLLKKNVFLMNTDIPGGQLIQDCDATIVICSTVALEALMVGKPSLYIGNWDVGLKSKIPKVDINDPGALEVTLNSEEVFDLKLINKQLNRLNSLQFSGNLFTGALHSQRYTEFSNGLLQKYSIMECKNENNSRP